MSFSSSAVRAIAVPVLLLLLILAIALSLLVGAKSPHPLLSMRSPEAARAPTALSCSTLVCPEPSPDCWPVVPSVLPGP